ncbi:MAG TPA: T9SS type A sorting domain-containing protein, partial [Bacteroidales bacterium]|nr:T9SS type A sorting domain-containing protein [Bacteroidales bacterium]
NSFSVFPNPATDNITVTMVEGTQATQVVVYNANGQQVRNANINCNDVTIDIKDLEAGVYFISLQNGNTVVGTSKMIRK